MSMLVKLGGRNALVSDFAGKVVKNQGPDGIYRAKNGFGHRLANYYPDPSATLTISSKTLKDGRNIVQRMWSWANGAKTALTERSDGFFSFVQINSSGKVTKSVISENLEHLVEKASTPKSTNGKVRYIPYENHVNGDKIASFIDGQLYHVDKSPVSAKYMVQDARQAARQSFRTIG